MLNWKKFLPALALILVVIFGFNPLLKFGLEKAGNAAFGAKTEIAGFSLNPFTGRLDIKRVQVANKNAPFTNLFELGALRLGLDTEQLFYARVNIPQATLDNIRLGTPRAKSGALPVKKKKAPAEKKPLDLNKLTRDLQLDPAAVQRAFQTAPPQASGEAERVQKENAQKLAEAKKHLAAVDVQKELAALNLNELSNLNISSADDLSKLQSLVAEKQKGLQKITDDLAANKAAAESAVKEAQANLEQLNLTAQKDLDNLLGALDLGNYDLGALGKELLGPKINGWLDTGLQYFELAKKYLPPKTAKKTKPPKKERFQGQTLVFPNNKTRPRFWLGRLGLSGVSGQGTANELTYSGYLNDLASEQHLIGRPTRIKITGAFTKRAQSLLDIDITLNHLGEGYADVYSLVLSGYDLTGAQFWDEQLIPLKITGGLGRIDAVISVAGDELDGEITLSGKNMRYEKIRGADGAAALVADAMQSAPELTVSIDLTGTLNSPRLWVKTNVDTLIKNRLEKEFGEQLAQAKQQLAAEYEKAIGGARQETEASLKQLEGEISATLAEQQKTLDGEKAKIEQKKKELEDQLNSQTDKIKKQAEDALKDALPNLKF
ncbi:MAG: TIGR03545 family protein [Candidatus Margulisbacteria bacterium]|jgi:uncharacterized protein (TIGR03545 family)|nr:TIGR03545 family protein [Candidatus Margulisiibacteriota bacterium]